MISPLLITKVTDLLAGIKVKGVPYKQRVPALLGSQSNGDISPAVGCHYF